MGQDLSYLQKVDAAVEFLDANQKPATVDGAPVWSTDNTDLLALEPSSDGMACVIRPLGPLGTANITVTADADMGSGTEPILASGEVKVTAGKATVVNLKFGTPTDQ